MNNQQARGFRERWQAVEAIEAKEQWTASIALRWQQMNATLRLAMGLGLLQAEEDSAEIEAVRCRWTLLKETAT